METASVAMRPVKFIGRLPGGGKDTNKNSLRIVKEPGFSCEANRIFGEAPGGATQ